MEHNWLLYVAAFAVAFAVSMLTTPFAKWVSIKVGAIDQPKERGVHKVPLPRLGGIAIVLGFFAAMFVSLLFMADLRTRQFMGFAVGASIIVALGALDDIFDLNAKLKAFVQLIAAVLVIASGTTMNFIIWPIPMFLKHLDIPITLIWIIGVTNAVNLIDGLDGLAAGVSSIAALCLTALCILSGTPMAVVFTAAIAGACLGFLPHNFNPSHVIMGDTGATFLGFTLAVSSLMGIYRSYAVLSLVIAVFAMALPIFDTFFAMVRRILSGRPIMSADRGHLHHRLIDAGYSHKATVLLLYSLSAVSGVVAILIALRDLRVTIVAALSLLVLCLIVYTYRRRVDAAPGAEEKPAEPPKPEADDNDDAPDA